MDGDSVRDFGKSKTQSLLSMQNTLSKWKIDWKETGNML